MRITLSLIKVIRLCNKTVSNTLVSLLLIFSPWKRLLGILPHINNVATFTLVLWKVSAYIKLANMVCDAGQKQSVYGCIKTNTSMEWWSFTCSKTYIEEVLEVPQQFLKLWSIHMKKFQKTIMFASSHVTWWSQRAIIEAWMPLSPIICIVTILGRIRS